MSATTDTAVRRSPTADELATWRLFIETANRLSSALGSRLQSESGVSTGDYTVLLALSEANGKRMRSSELAAHIDWERSRVSHHLGRMERRALIVREDCATDNRGAEVVLTPLGADLFRRASVAHLHAIQQLFVETLSSEQLEAARDLAETLATHLDSRAAAD